MDSTLPKTQVSHLTPPQFVMRKRYLNLAALIVLIGLLVWSSFETGFSLTALFKGIGNSVKFSTEFFPPNFSRGGIYL